MLAETWEEVLLVNTPSIDGYELCNMEMGSVGVIVDDPHASDSELYREARRYAFEFGFDTCVNCRVVTTSIVTGYGEVDTAFDITRGKSSTQTKILYCMYFTMCNRNKK